MLHRAVVPTITKEAPRAWRLSRRPLARPGMVCNSIIGYLHARNAPPGEKKCVFAIPRFARFFRYRMRESPPSPVLLPYRIQERRTFRVGRVLSAPSMM